MNLQSPVSRWVGGITGLLILLLILGACSAPSAVQPTLIPTEMLPTAIAQTVQARGINRPEPSSPASQLRAGSPQPAPSYAPGSAAEAPEPTASPAPPTATRPAPTATGRPANPTSTLAPPFPEAIVQIYRLGELSRMTSPIKVTTRLASEWGKVVRVELYGEDGRLLARYLRTFNNLPWNSARIDVDLEFEISAAGEAGRLVVSVEDQYDRLIDVNSVDLILLSSGTTQLNPATALWQRLIISEPRPKALIQGGHLFISGRALPNRSDQPLRVMLVAEDGRVLGQRLAKVEVNEPGNYGTYIAEVPYSVPSLTPARLVIFEEGEPVSDIAHLSSIEVILAP